MRPIAWVADKWIRRATGRRSWQALCRWLQLGASVVLLVAAAACARPGDDALSFQLPTTVAVDLGEAVPGTDLIYLERDPDGAVVLIGGERALKRAGDSLDWQGRQGDGVDVVLRMRVVWIGDEALRLAGTAEVTVREPAPQATDRQPGEGPSYAGPVTHRVQRGQVIPGTTIAYEGKEPEGAHLGGVEGYRYRKVGDSVLWQGVVRDGVHLRLDSRVLYYDAGNLVLGGVVTLGLSP